MEIYLVGGAVRDKLLDLQVFDRDWVVVGSTVEEMISQGYKPVGDDFPVFLHPETKEEYALARTERKTAKGYRGFQFHASPEVTLEQDLQRRDLTINAIAEDLNGNLIDPCNGLADIKARKLRHVSQAFTEDPVRVLRVARLSARFAPQGFTIADQTGELLQKMVDNGEVDALVPERVWQEMDKSLSEPTARIFFETLRGCGALKVLMPELDKLFGIPQPEKWHPEIDTGLHTMMALDQICQLSDQNATRFAIICHDLGKGQTPKADLPCHPGHEALSAELTGSLCRRLKTPTSYRDLASLVARFHTHVHRALELNAGTLTKTLSSLDISRKPERFEQFLLACEADARGRLGLEDRDYPQAEWFQKAATAYLDVDAGAIAKTVMTKAQASNTSPDKNNIANDIHQARVRSVKNFISTQH